jgi:hypothetical protein
MNKEFFQRLFQAKQGYVYRYTKSVPDGESIAHHITAAFAISSATNLLNTVVIELPNYNVTVIYADSEENLNNSSDFELITDLIPEVVVDQLPVVEETTPPTEG